jgi:hypothetical protein
MSEEDSTRWLEEEISLCIAQFCVASLTLSWFPEFNNNLPLLLGCGILRCSHIEK